MLAESRPCDSGVSPYRKRDGTYERDALTHPYLAGHGYAGRRRRPSRQPVNRRLLFGEVRGQQQDDGVELIASCPHSLVQLAPSFGNDRNLLGWIQWTSDRSAPSAGTQGNRHHLFQPTTGTPTMLTIWRHIPYHRSG